MSEHSTDAAYAAVRAVETETLSRDGAERLLGDVRRLRSWLDAVEIATTRRVRELNAAGQAENAESLVATAGRRSGRQAKAVGERTDLSDQAPTLADALAHGDVAAAHLDAVNAAARGLPDDVRAELLAHSDEMIARASQVSVEGFGRECRELAKRLLAASRHGSDAAELDAQRAASNVKRWVDRITGMHHTHLELDPLRDAQLSATFNAELARLRAADGHSGTPWEQLQVDAFLNAVAGIRTPPPAGRPSSPDVDGDAGADTGADTDPGGGSGGGSRTGGGCSADSGADGMTKRGRRVDRVPQVTLLVSLDWLAGVADGGICETENGIPLPISTARRLCCEAEVIPTVLGTAGEVLDQGRSVRTATEAQRRALRAMHRCCAYPGCEVGFDSCRIHHVRWWGRDNGATDLANLLPVCERHHHLVHEGGWVLTLDADRIATWTRPDGEVHHVGPTINRTRERPLTMSGARG